jgi:hypothetical protein
MSKEEFEQEYCKKSGITLDQYHNEYNQITLPCNCDSKDCNGWVAVTNEPLLVECHMKIYGR